MLFGTFSMFFRKLCFYISLMRLNKPIGSLLLFCPTFWAVWLASHSHPSPKWFFTFLIGCVLTRSAGCVFNDIADRNIDQLVKRTAARPLATGALSVTEALSCAIFLLVVCFILAILLLPASAFGLALLSVFMMLSYPYTKRFFALPQAYLGLSFGMGIPMAYVAIRNDLPPEAWVLYLCNFFWAIAYDTVYAMVDREDDLKIGIRTSAITFGRYDVFMVALCYSAMVILLVYLGFFLGRGLGYFVFIALAVLNVLYIMRLIVSREAAFCFRAFMLNGLVGILILLGIVISTI